MGLTDLTGAGCSKVIEPQGNTGAYAGKKSEFMNAEDMAKIVQNGDLLEFKRFVQLGKLKKRFYTHWGVCVGEHENKPMVAHMFIIEEGGVQETITSAFIAVTGDLESAEVRLDALDDVCTDLCRINNLDDRKYTKLDTQMIFKRAIDMLGQHNYNLIYNNCEHFAKWCRYDKHTSNQVTRWQPAVSTTMKFLFKMAKIATVPTRGLTSILPMRL